MHAVQQVVKQTVMTSVYGVTYVGAKAQIYSQLEEKLSQVISTVAATTSTADTDTSSSKDDAAAAASAAAEAHEQAVHDCAAFLTGLTLEAIRGLFTEARGIMDWLATLAKLVARAGQPMAWVTPLGLPVVQPYR
jgi:DNA-directed RNA polymerase, mitochondrial